MAESHIPRARLEAARCTPMAENHIPRARLNAAKKSLHLFPASASVLTGVPPAGSAFARRWRKAAATVEVLGPLLGGLSLLAAEGSKTLSSRQKAIESPRARQGLGMLCHAALSFFMLSTAFWGDGLKKFSTGTSWLLAASLFLRKAQSRYPLGLCSWVPKACASSRAPWRSPPLRGPLSLPPSLAPFNPPFAQRLQSLHGALPKGMAV